MAQNDDPKRKALKQTIRTTPGVKMAKQPIDKSPALPAHRKGVAQVSPQIQQGVQLQELERRMAQPAGTRLTDEPTPTPTPTPTPAPTPTAEPPVRQELEAQLAGTVGGAAAQPPGIRAGTGALPERLASQPEYQEAAELRRTGPAGIRAGTVGKYAAGETPFSQEQWERANTIRKYQESPETAGLTPRELEARTPREIGGGTTVGDAGPIPGRNFGPKLSEQNEIARRYASLRRGTESTTVLARLAEQEGAERTALRKSYEPNIEEARLRQTADIAQATGLRAEKKLASEERRARLSGIRASGKEAAAERGRERTFQVGERGYATEQYDKGLERMTTVMDEDGSPYQDPDLVRRATTFRETSGITAQSSPEVQRAGEQFFNVAAAMSRAEGKSANPFDMLRVPGLKTIVSFFDKKGTPHINVDAARNAAREYDTAGTIGGVKINPEHFGVSEAQLIELLNSAGTLGAAQRGK